MYMHAHAGDCVLRHNYLPFYTCNLWLLGGAIPMN
jgi:hypothetical protein